MKIDSEIIIYTDGSCKERPRRGGIGIRYIIPDYDNGTEITYDESRGSYIGATNNQMELLSCIIALEKLLDYDISRLRRITIYVDSNYVRMNVSNAIFNWPKNNWTSVEGLPIENVIHWKRLVKVYKKFTSKIIFEKVKAHQKGKNKDLHNDAVDKLAKSASDNPIEIPFNVVNARKKFSKKYAIKGCVKICDKEIVIRIITCTSYKNRKDIYKYKYKYVVTSEDSPFCDYLDWIYYNKRLYEGHTYIVTMELKNKNPFIKKIIKDITNKSRFNVPVS